MKGLGVNPTSKHRIAVIGGGLSGLATAAKLNLADPGLEICLFESQSRLGGVIYSEHVDDFLVDHGADMFATNPPGVLDFCEQLGVSDRLIVAEESRRGARIVHRGRLVPVPDGFVLMRATQLSPLLKTPLLSVMGKLRFLTERWVKSAGEQTDELHDESVAHFVRRRMGAETLDRLVAPLVAGIYTADVAKLSMRSTMGSFMDMEQEYGSLAKATVARRRSGEDSVERMSAGARYSQFRSFRGGMYELIEAMASELSRQSLRLQTTVQSISRDVDRWELTLDGGQRERFDHVVVATPPRAAARLLQDVVSVAARELAEVESASTAIVVLGVRRSDIYKDIDTFGFVVPPIEKRKILACSFASHKFAGRAPEDHVLIRVFVGGSLQPELLALDDQELIQLARTELSSLIGLEGDPVMAKVVRWMNAMPQYHVGHAARVSKIEQAVKQAPGLSIASNVLHGVGIAPVIRMADQVAKEVVERLAELSDPPRRDTGKAGNTS